MFARLWSFQLCLVCTFFYFLLSFICFAPAQLVFYLASFNAVIAMIFRFRFRSVCLSVCRPGWLRCDCRWLRSRYQLFSVLSAEFSRFTWGKNNFISFSHKRYKTRRRTRISERGEKKRNDRHDKCHRKTSSESTREARERKRDWRGDRASERGREGERSKQ